MKVLDHVGIAVASLEQKIAFYATLGVAVEGREEVASQNVRVAFLPVEGTRLELLEPTAPESPIAKFIDNRGEGLHHLCFRVDDIRAAMTDLRGRGYRLLTDEPQAGAHGDQVCFVHPQSSGGVLIELSQPAGSQP